MAFHLVYSVYSGNDRGTHPMVGAPSSVRASVFEDWQQVFRSSLYVESLGQFVEYVRADSRLGFLLDRNHIQPSHLSPPRATGTMKPTVSIRVREAHSCNQAPVRADMNQFGGLQVTNGES